tara:strand:+ start:465 stop:725 length:261 start_codon:yes stop_codon:yes gene_type:complete
MPKFVEKLRTDNYQGAEVYRVDGLLGNEIDTFITEGTEIPELSLFATRVKKAFRGCELRQQDKSSMDREGGMSICQKTYSAWGILG